MSHSSEERIPQSDDAPQSARIIPFERPQSELQRAVQRRAQEHLEALSVKPKKSLARQLITFAIALIPVTIIFSGFLLAVHAVRIITALYLAPQEQTTEAAAPALQAPEPPQPGVVILVPDKSIAPIEPPQPEAVPQAQ